MKLRVNYNRDFKDYHWINGVNSWQAISRFHMIEWLGERINTWNKNDSNLVNGAAAFWWLEGARKKSSIKTSMISQLRFWNFPVAMAYRPTMRVFHLKRFDQVRMIRMMWMGSGWSFRGVLFFDLIYHYIFVSGDFSSAFGASTRKSPDFDDFAKWT